MTEYNRLERVLARFDPVYAFCALGILTLVVSFILGCFGVLSW